MTVLSWPVSVLSKVQPLFDLMGQKTWYFGEVAAQPTP